MKHHTVNPSERAASIANKEAEKHWNETHSWKEYYKIWMEVYHQVLLEFVFQG